MDYKAIIVQWMEFKIPEVMHRDINIVLDKGFIITITGPRRSGKTYMCFQLMHSLSRKNLLYLNFEDNKLLNAGADDLDKLLESFYELSDVNKDSRICLFLDEIQNVRDWDAWTRKMHDYNKNIQLIITGSSSKMLSRELSTKLRGRTLEHEIFPLSFKEFLEWRNISYNMKTLSYSRDKIGVKKAFSEYMKNGGYPALISFDDRKTVLQSYYDTMILKDVVERHNVSDVNKLRLVANLLIESASREISYNKLANKLKSIGVSMSKNTIIEYISYMEECYLVFQNLKYEYSLTKQLGAIKKLYVIDTGLLNAISFKYSEDNGKLLENIIYIQLRRQSREIYYHSGKNECDFIIKDGNRIISAIQACYELNDDNRDREVKGLLEAMSEHKLREGLIITLDQDDEFIIDKKKIRVVPAWKWLLG
ncbi:TPA: ATP-binding protein [Candidatus Woesearchaeota archaeon]|nr:hypothetical protein [uncultured archaeon]MBS3172992.1 ATP-binding protein [Candidatus Woesearchaeota archaeon]HIH31917.1 ATP-binding protein [Candidatus Woesearchaeota archaeon]HIH54331.1 ATP-binding protein [Candidatus Woesearchaeota archaeon]HIJ02157.1 ATP-binding protein [Candidatus Woesearchaeota archaeon]